MKIKRGKGSNSKSSIPSISDQLSSGSWEEYDSGLVTDSLTLSCSESLRSASSERFARVLPAASLLNPSVVIKTNSLSSPLQASTKQNCDYPALLRAPTWQIPQVPAKPIKEPSIPVEQDVRVSVSGVIFKLQPEIFLQLEKLPWQWSRCNQLFSLQTSPDLFEIILNHLLYGSIPCVKSLNQADLEELEPMALLLGLTELHEELQDKRGRGGRRHSTASLVESKSLLSSSRRKSDGGGPMLGSVRRAPSQKSKSLPTVTSMNSSSGAVEADAETGLSVAVALPAQVAIAAIAAELAEQEKLNERTNHDSEYDDEAAKSRQRAKGLFGSPGRRLRLGGGAKSVRHPHHVPLSSTINGESVLYSTDLVL